MKKIVLIYASTHHGNTRKLAEAISSRYKITLIDAVRQETADLSGYDLIGFASGIDFGRFYEPVERFLERNLPDGKRVFFLYTCAKPDDRFTGRMREKALQRNAILLGTYGCRRYNTYGPLKLIGGMNKGHPTAEELDGAIRFVKTLLEGQRD